MLNMLNIWFKKGTKKSCCGKKKCNCGDRPKGGKPSKKNR